MGKIHTTYKTSCWVCEGAKQVFFLKLCHFEDFAPFAHTLVMRHLTTAFKKRHVFVPVTRMTVMRNKCKRFKHGLKVRLSDNSQPPI